MRHVAHMNIHEWGVLVMVIDAGLISLYHANAFVETASHQALIVQKSQSVLHGFDPVQQPDDLVTFLSLSSLLLVAGQWSHGALTQVFD